MSKTVRNTLFTLTMLGLTTFGLEWNKEVAAERDPVAIGRAVLASQPSQLSIDDQVFPLQIDFSKPVIKLGQAQQVAITTAPYATLAIVIVYPNESIVPPEARQAQADASGHYSFQFHLDDFRLLGSVTVSVVATVDTKTTEASQTFSLQSWLATDEIETPEERTYSHPLIP